MPRLKPPPSSAMMEDHTPPTEPIEIELAGDEPLTTEVELAPEKKVEPEPAPIVEENPLQKQLDAQKRAEEMQRNDLQRQIRERDETIARERGGREDAEYNSVLTAIAAEQATLDKAEADYAAYAGSGDFATAAKVQRVMAVASARLDRLEEGKSAFEQRRKEAPEPAPREPERAAPLDFEQQIAKMPESAKTWLRKHPEFISDTSLNRKIGGVHNYLVDTKGVEPFSTDYFDALDGEFGFKAAPAAPAAEPSPQPRRSMPVSAPVSRDVPTATGTRPASSKMTLSQEERLIARSAFTAPDMTNEQKELLYAQQKRKLQTMRQNGSYPQSERN